MDQKFMQLYADFIVKVGVNVQPRQNFIVRCPVTMPEFAHACARAGYEAGAKRVVVRWEDERLSRIDMELAAEEDLKAMKPYELRSWLDFAEDPDGCCTLAIHAADPEAYAGLDAGKLNRVNLAEALAGVHHERPGPVVRGGGARPRLGRQGVPRHAGGRGDGKAVGPDL